MALDSGRTLSTRGRWLVVLACSAALLSTLACGGGDESAEEESAASPMPKIEKGTREITLPGTEGDPVRAVVAAGELPEGYPSDLPPPAGSEPMNAMIIPGQGGLVTFQSKESREDVYEHWKKELPDQGWDIETEEDSLRYMIRASKSGRTAMVTVASPQGGTEFAVTFEGS
jgi:hypothetical protein